ncbi:hypothetical protein CCMSSC00406_0010307 [Pleurotus cornucopiae]|uniref:Uncharacterized protein n=1 Tax=Pleurotus cornucopiae TaxID=5321 RepID=A0ACB7IZK6_PLECO|nr:hypothetical protein CCMSSC00406_0010307 [Pleurotus cornucopiae]
MYERTSSHLALLRAARTVCLPSHPAHQLALELLRRNTFGGVLSFGIKVDDSAAQEDVPDNHAPPPDAACKVIDSLELASNVANVGK